MPAGVEIALKLDKRELAQLDRALRLVGERVYDKVMGQAANAAMKPMLRAARRRVPVAFGLLKTSLGTKMKRYRRRRIAWVGMGPRAGFRRHMTYATGAPLANPVNYAHLVEFGTRPHSLTRGERLPRRRHATELKRAGYEEAAREVVHPGARPQPFMRPAYDETKHRVVKRYTRLLLRGLYREVGKLRKGA